VAPRASAACACACTRTYARACGDAGAGAAESLHAHTQYIPFWQTKRRAQPFAFGQLYSE